MQTWQMASSVSYGKPFVLKILITIDKTQSVVLKCQSLAIKLKKGIVGETIVKQLAKLTSFKIKESNHQIIPFKLVCEMLFKIYAKSEFFQNSCMKRDQNYLLNTVFLNPNYFSLY